MQPVKYPMGFTCVDNRVLTSQTFRLIKPASRLVYLYVAQYRNNDTGLAFPAQDTIATNMNVSIATVRRGIKELVEVGLLDKVPTKARHNTYRFRYDGVEADGYAQQFDYPVEAASAQVEIEAPEQPITEAPALTLVENPKPPRPTIELGSVAACVNRLDKAEYPGFNGAHLAAAIWFDHYTYYNNAKPIETNWPATMHAARKLYDFHKGDRKLLFEWVKAAFDCAVEKRISFRDGPSGVKMSSLMNQYNALKIGEWIREARNPVSRDDGDQNSMFVRSK